MTQCDWQDLKIQLLNSKLSVPVCHSVSHSLGFFLILFYPPVSFLCLSVYLSVFLSPCLYLVSVCMSAYMVFSLCMPIYLSVCLPVYCVYWLPASLSGCVLSPSMSVHSSACLLVFRLCLLLCLPDCLFLFLFVCLCLSTCLGLVAVCLYLSVRLLGSYLRI